MNGNHPTQSIKVVTNKSILSHHKRFQSEKSMTLKYSGSQILTHMTVAAIILLLQSDLTSPKIRIIAIEAIIRSVKMTRIHLKSW